MPPSFAKLGTGFNASGASRIDLANNVVHLGDGGRLDYDFLVIATGPKLAFEEIEGLGPRAHTNSICDVGRSMASSVTSSPIGHASPAAGARFRLSWGLHPGDLLVDQDRPPRQHRRRDPWKECALAEVAVAARGMDIGLDEDPIVGTSKPPLRV